MSALQIGHNRRWLAALLLLAVVLRVGSAVAQGNQVAPLPGIYDQLSYHALAQRVLAGEGFSFAEPWWPATRAGEPTAHWSYLYTAFLAGSYGLAGVAPVAPRVVQALLVGLLHTWLTWRIGQRLFGASVGWVAALWSALYIYFVYYAGALMTEPFYMVGILWTLDAALRLGATAPERPSRRWWLGWLELGLALGLTILLRQIFLLFVPFLFLWLWWCGRRRQPAAVSQAGSGQTNVRRQALLGMLVSTLVVVALIAPWTWRNYRAFGAVVPLNTNAGFALFWGNHPIYGTQFVGILPAGGPSYQELIPAELLPLNEAELDQALLRRAIGFVVDDPLRYILLSASRTVEYFKFWPSAESSLFSNVARVSSFGVALPFIVYGLWAVGRMWPGASSSAQQGIVLLLLFAAVYSMVHLLSWALIRYRLPVDAVLLFFAAYGLVDLLQRLRQVLPHRAGAWAASGEPR